MSLAPYQPGETFEFSYNFVAAGGTGFGETGVFAAIGDPFDLSLGSGVLALAPVSAVPEPATWLLWAGGPAPAGAARRRAVRLRIPRAGCCGGG